MTTHRTKRTNKNTISSRDAGQTFPASTEPGGVTERVLEVSRTGWRRGGGGAAHSTPDRRRLRGGGGGGSQTRDRFPASSRHRATVDRRRLPPVFRSHPTLTDSAAPTSPALPPPLCQQPDQGHDLGPAGLPMPLRPPPSAVAVPPAHILRAGRRRDRSGGGDDLSDPGTSDAHNQH